jgi:hypothetical protein
LLAGVVPVSIHGQRYILVGKDINSCHVPLSNRSCNLKHARIGFLGKRRQLAIEDLASTTGIDYNHVPT